MAQIQVLGSPPQVRGKEAYTYTDKSTDRITPAGAGKRNLDKIEKPW